MTKRFNDKGLPSLLALYFCILDIAFCAWIFLYLGFPDGLVVKNLPANAGDTGLIPDMKRSHAEVGEGNGNPLQYSFLPGESQGQRSLVGCRLWGLTESDMTVAT